MWRRWGTTWIFFWHLLINLKNKYLKKLLEWANKKQNNFIIYNAAFFENTWRYHYFTHVYQKFWWYDSQFLRYRQTEIGNFRSFFALSPLKTQKSKILKKWKKLLEISFYTYVPKIKITWCTVPEKRSKTDIIFCHFGAFFALLTH